MTSNMQSLVIALAGLCGLKASAFVPTASSHAPTATRESTALKGGYDSTVGIDPTTPLQFFTTPGNTCPYAARTYIVLKELDVPFDMTEVSGRPKPDWYLKINPRGKVPAIKVPTQDNRVVYESAICCEYLCDAEEYPTTLMPRDAMARATIRLLNDHCDNAFTPAQFTFLMNKDEDKHDELCQGMETALLAYEEALEESGGPYLMGNDFTLADAHVLPFMLRLVVSLRYFKEYELPRDKFPKLLDWYDLCSQRVSVKAAALNDEKIIEIYKMFVDMDYKFGGLNKN